MKRYKKNKCKVNFGEIFNQYLPIKTDNLKQIALKLIFFILIVSVIASGTYFGSYYFKIYKEERILSETRQIFYSDRVAAERSFKKQNSDYKAWLSFGNTQLNNPVFQAGDNKYYLSHDSRKQESLYGALFFDYRTKPTDKNKVIYGKTDSYNAMFSVLHNLRSLDFYNQNSVFSFTCDGVVTKYKVFAVFVLNASRADDEGRIYDIYRKEFDGNEKFNSWIADAKNRSVITANVDVELQDDILTLVTSCDDFPNARLVVMARSGREQEILSSETPVAHINEHPQYPKKWYDVRNIEYPF